MRFFLWCRACALKGVTHTLHRLAHPSGSVPALEHFARFELVHGAAVRALALAIVAHVDIDAGVAVPQLHVGHGVGAVKIACGVQVVGGQFNGGRGGGHGDGLFRSNQSNLWDREG